MEDFSGRTGLSPVHKKLCIMHLEHAGNLAFDLVAKIKQPKYNFEIMDVILKEVPEIVARLFAACCAVESG